MRVNIRVIATSNRDLGQAVKSGVFREDGSWVLWGEPMTEAVYGFQLRWRPIATPARQPWLLPALMAGLALAGAVCCLPRKS